MQKQVPRRDDNPSGISREDAIAIGLEGLETRVATTALVCYLSDPDFNPEGVGYLDNGYCVPLFGRVVDVRSLSVAWQRVAGSRIRPYGYWVVGNMTSNSQPVLYLFPDSLYAPVYRRLGLTA